MSAIAERTPDSIKAYTKLGLHLYDAVAMGFLSPRIWGCPACKLVEHYRKHVTSNHADIGVGTGYVLDRCGFDTPRPRLALIDLQPNCLEHAARRLARYRPSTHLHDIWQPLPPLGRRFDSVALGGILHCLAGDFHQKGRIFDGILPLTAPGAKVFGYTLVADTSGLFFRRHVVRNLFNRIGIIGNARDTLGDLARELSRRFDDCTVDVVGDMAFFSAVVPHAAHGGVR